MIKIILTILALLYFLFDVLVRGSKLLIDGKDITVFPYSLIKIIAKISGREYSPNLRKQRAFIFYEVFVSGMIVAGLSSVAFYFLLKLSN